MPEAARHRTKDGAIAFAKYYVEQINETGIHPKKGVLEPLALGSCKSCDNFEKTVLDLVRDDQHFNVPSIVATRYFYLEPSTTVGVVSSSPAASLLNAKGEVVDTYPAQSASALMIELKWTADGWRIATITEDKSVTS